MLYASRLIKWQLYISHVASQSEHLKSMKRYESPKSDKAEGLHLDYNATKGRHLREGAAHLLLKVTHMRQRFKGYICSRGMLCLERKAFVTEKKSPKKELHFKY